MGSAPGIDLSIVVAAAVTDRSLEDSIAALEESCTGLAVEIFVVGRPGPERVERPPTGPRVVFLPADPRALVPELWAAGIEQAHGRVVALTTGHMIVSPGWAHALVQGLEPPAAGAGGPIEPGPETGVVDWAIYYLRYSPYLSASWVDGPVAGDIAGDNAAYLLEDLRRYSTRFSRGFWEVDFHRAMRAEGRMLRAVSAARARFGRSHRPGTFLRQRFSHGRQFGSTRVREQRDSRVAVVARAPLVPLVLAWRAARRVRVDAAHARRFFLSLPAFLVFSAAWAAGEAVGAIFGEGDPALR